jgi:hypothetical protein
VSSQPSSNQTDVAASARPPGGDPGFLQRLSRTEWSGPAGVPVFIAVFGAVLYLTFRVAASRFYGPFGLAPEDVNLGYAGLLTESAAGFLTALLISVVLVTIVVRLSRRVPAFERMTHWADAADGFFRSVGRYIAVFAAVVAAGVVFAFVYTGLKALWIPLADVLQIVVAFVSIASFVRGPLEASALERFVGVSAVTLLLGTVVVGAALLDVITTGSDDADAVRLGRVPESSWFGIALYPWDATVACLALPGYPRDGSRECEAKGVRAQRRCVMYLGENTSAVFAYDPATRHTFRIPTGEAKLELLPDSNRCTRPDPRARELRAREKGHAAPPKRTTTLVSPTFTGRARSRANNSRP